MSGLGSLTAATSTTVTIRVDLTSLTNAMENLARSARRVAVTMERFTEKGRQRQELALVGLESRFYVRGGLDPLYASQAALDGLVRDILRDAALGWEVMAAGVLPTRENRIRLAVAAIEGWVGPEESGA